jgi:hypothetical protein
MFVNDARHVALQLDYNSITTLDDAGCCTATLVLPSLLLTWPAASMHVLNPNPAAPIQGISW